jgi:RNA polymerase sigma-70 factor (ECF subfamily)
MRVAFEANAADILGDAMVTAWKRVSKLPTEPERARMWLFVVARNTLLNHRRTLGRHRVAVDRLRGILVLDIAAATSDIDRTETRVAVLAAMEALTPAERELVRLINWDGFTLAEVAELEGLAASTIRSRYAKALKQLSALLNVTLELDSATVGGPLGEALP